MFEDVKADLLEVARRALKATEEGHLEWTRTSEAPPEYYAHITDNTAVAIQKTGGRRPRRPPTGPGMVDAAATGARVYGAIQTDEYQLALTTPEHGEIASLSSHDLSLQSDEYAVLRRLFEAALMAGENVGEAIEEVLTGLERIAS